MSCPGTVKYLLVQSEHNNPRVATLNTKLRLYDLGLDLNELHRCNLCIWVHTCLFREGTEAMNSPLRTPQVPSNWFVDPVNLGVPGLRRIEEDEALAWQADALCAQTDPEAFFPEKGGSTREAKKVCDGCEVRSQCLEYALANDERFGIWGGLSERERRKLRKAAS